MCESHRFTLGFRIVPAVSEVDWSRGVSRRLGGGAVPGGERIRLPPLLRSGHPRPEALPAPLRRPRECDGLLCDGV